MSMGNKMKNFYCYVTVKDARCLSGSSTRCKGFDTLDQAVGWAESLENRMFMDVLIVQDGVGKWYTIRERGVYCERFH